MNSTFSGDAFTEWLTDAGDDRRMRLLDDFSFTDAAGRVWGAPIGSIIDGASIPRALWTLVGSPYVGDYRRASIVHDVACDIAGTDVPARRAADRMFYEACRAGGCTVRQATILYLGVRVGASWAAVPLWTPALAAESTGPRLHRLATEEHMERTFRQAAELVLADGETDDTHVIEHRADRALHAIAPANLP